MSGTDKSKKDESPTNPDDGPYVKRNVAPGFPWFNAITLAASIIAIVVSILSYMESRAAAITAERSSRAELFITFQQQYVDIAAKFPPDVFRENFIVAENTDAWLAIREYWVFCFAEWYATQKLERALYEKVWHEFYGQVIPGVLRFPAFKVVFIDLIARSTASDLWAEFGGDIVELAVKKGSLTKQESQAILAKLRRKND